MSNMATAVCSDTRGVRDASSAPDTLVIVRPPTLQHSLALQVQLIHPHAPEVIKSSAPPPRRKMTPLYSLHHHAHRSTHVSDAASDEKVAKFIKRGIEVPDLAILDLVQANDHPLPTSSAPSSPPASTVSSSPPSSLNRVDTDCTSSDSKRPSLIRKLRNLAFQQSAPSSAEVSSTPPKPPASSFEGILAFGLAHALPISRLPTLSLDPTPSPSYTFVIGKWLRDTSEGAANEIGGAVTFEWRREEPRRRVRGRSGTMVSMLARDESPIPTPPASPQLRPTVVHRDSLSVPGTPPLIQHRRASSTPNTDIPERPHLTSAFQSFDLSSTSPTPSLLAPSSRSRSSSISSDPSSALPASEPPSQVWNLYLSPSPSSPSSTRYRLATLSPTPSHPRLVAHVSVPPLPADFPEEKVGMSVEEVEECLSVLCLWLVVKESAGAEGKACADGGWWKRRGSK
ncbi:hypothetical protein BCR35DRAFT_299875 [Leucosporidium creatinivorum]|uniref:Uncharacterized protein n=1 Tax=Leucosporidium creatinivorum TaxID=106004 RepID=A0A1Y2G0W3_9BASI|nr:hypothetical protein BCR35DRAFT_299875 [Leucosporidium creatinivorum]